MPDAISVTVNFPEFQRALLEYEKAVTNHDLPYILNRAGRNVATKASHNTPRATVAEINSEMRSIAPGTKRSPFLFVLTNAKRKAKGLPPVGGALMSAPATDFLKQRRSSRAYIAAGWTPAIVKFGGHTRAHISNKSKINQANNQLASSEELVAILENAAAGAGKVGSEALEKALVDTSRDMIEFAHKKLEETAKEYSSK
jgi:hypothetical protein